MKNGTNRFTGSKRAAHDFYPTPPEAVKALLSVEEFEGDIWEPACWDWAISKELQNAGYNVVSTDLIDRGFVNGGSDFLKSSEPLAKNIITNPPYGSGLADKFVRKALIHCRKTGWSVAMLLNLRSIAHVRRTKKFMRTPPAAIYVIDDLKCWPNGKVWSYNDKISYQQYYWAVWRPEHKWRPSFWWLSMNDFKNQL